MTRFWKRMITGLAVALGLVASSGTADAAFIAYFENVNPGFGSAGKYNWYQKEADLHPNLVYQNVTGTSPNLQYHFVTFCLQIDQNLASNPHTFILNQLQDAPDPASNNMGPATASDIKRMWATYRASLDTGSASIQAAKSAAFQLSIWYLIGQIGLSDIANYNNTYTPIDGVGDDTISEFASKYLDSSSWGTTEANLYALTGLKDQDQVVEMDENFVFPVPAPPALILALVGVVPCLALRRRLRGQTAAA